MILLFLKLLFETVSRPCYDAMFRAFPDFVASLERMHGVSLVFQFGRNRDGEHVVEIHVSTSGVLPDVLSAQWEIEKVGLITTSLPVRLCSSLNRL